MKIVCWTNVYKVADPEGGVTGARPPPPNKKKKKIGSTIFFTNPVCIRMLKNKAQIARESIKKILELPGPLRGPWTPADSEFGSGLVMCVWEHNLLRPPSLNENSGSAPVSIQVNVQKYEMFEYKIGRGYIKPRDSSSSCLVILFLSMYY